MNKKLHFERLFSLVDKPQPLLLADWDSYLNQFKFASVYLCICVKENKKGEQESEERGLHETYTGKGEARQTERANGGKGYSLPTCVHYFTPILLMPYWSSDPFSIHTHHLPPLHHHRDTLSRAYSNKMLAR